MKTSYISLVICIIFSIITAYWWYSTYSLKKLILYKLIDDNSANIKNIFSNTLWEKYSVTFELLDNNVAKIMESQYYKKFESEVRTFFHNSNLLQVLIYSKYNEPLFSLYNVNKEEHQHYALNHYLKRIYEDHTGDITVVLPIYTNHLASLPEAMIELKYDSSPFIEYIDNIYLSSAITITILTLVVLSIIHYLLLVNRNALRKQYMVNLKLKMAKESAEENNLKKSIFLANISHELKTPLNSIIGFSQLMRENPDSTINNYQEHINDIYNSGVHLLSLINDILDFSKTEVNKLTIQNSLFDLNKVLESSIRMIDPRAKKYNLHINVDIPQEPTIITADARRMKQVFLNILSNALKFTQENGTITISITKTSEAIKVQIKDTGIGIAEKDLAKAMSTFGQTDSALSRKYEGTGLGLPLSKRLVELMGGSFHIESKKEYGTSVTIKFSIKNA